MSDPVVDVRVEAGTGKLAQGGVSFVFPNDMLKVEAEPNWLNDKVLVRYSVLTGDDVIVRYEGTEVVGITVLHASRRES